MSQKIDVTTHGGPDGDGQRPFAPTYLLGFGAAALTLEGCRLVGDIFRAGVFVGVVGIILLVALFFGLIRLLSG